MKRIKVVVAYAAAALCFLTLAAHLYKLHRDGHFYDGYNPNLPLNPIVQNAEERPEYVRIAFSFEGLPGLSVPTLMARPKNSPGPLPCVIFLHGIGQKKEFLDELAPMFTAAGFALVSSDQYTRGERKLPGSKPLLDLLALRRRAALNVIETRRLIDYLQTRSDIAPDRIYLVGASFGAITGATAAAMEPRIKAAVLTYGGGNLALLLDSRQSAKQAGAFTAILKYAGAYVFAAADPIRHIHEVTPRPLFFQNGADDTLVPPAAGRALYNAAQDPKSITWYPGDHIGLDPATTKQVLNDAVTWVKLQDHIAITPQPEPAK